MTESLDFDTDDVRAVGVGLTAEYDTRDLPINTYTGRYFKVQALFNDDRSAVMTRISPTMSVSGLTMSFRIRSC